MENQATSIICPNCGATTTNHHNCEYCGSFLVQKASEGIDMKEYLNIASQYKNDEILSAVKKYIDYVKSNPYTDKRLTIYLKGSYTIYLRSNRSKDTVEMTKMGVDGVGIYMTFFKDADMLSHNFEHSNVFKAFTAYSIYVGGTVTESTGSDEKSYYADFGYDAEGACQVLLQLMSEVYGLDPTFADNYNLFNWDEEDKKNAFIENHYKEAEKADKEERKTILKWILIPFGILLLWGLINWLLESLYII